MEDVAATLSNKWVLMAGVALGAFLLYSHMSNANATNAASVQSPFLYNPGGVALDSNAANYLDTQAQYAAEMGLAQINADASKFSAYDATIQNLNNNAAQVAIAMTTAHQNILTTASNNAAAVAIDQTQNDARSYQAWLSADIATHGQDTALATVQSNNAASIANTKATLDAAVAENTNTTLADVLNAHIAAGSALALANVGSAKDITLANISATSQNDLAQIKANSDAALANINGNNANTLATINANSNADLATLAADNQLAIAKVNSQTAISTAQITSATQLGVAGYAEQAANMTAYWNYKGNKAASGNSFLSTLAGAAGLALAL